MKLRIKDNSLRFRLLRSEVEALARTKRIEAYTTFSLIDPSDRICYAIEHADDYQSLAAVRIGFEVRITISSREIVQWARSEVVGLYGEQPIYGSNTLSIAIEKDFACIDRSDADNIDTFENPRVLC